MTNSTSQSSSPICVRFAPSPTGRLHIGGVRTALFNYLYARQQGGKFVLRIEDTDRERSKPEHEEEILCSMRWLGLEWDGEPIRQSSRLDRYREAAAELIAKGLAYEAEAPASGASTGNGYSSEFATQPAQFGKKAIYFRMPKQPVKFKDLVHDEVAFDSSLWEDLVIMKSDGYPTYHFAVVVDDHDMGITHVIRGDDHLTNTPKHILLYLAFGWKPPKYAHLPLIMGTDGTPLSKRHGAVAAADYREQGYLPQATLNYLALLGWGPEGNEEIFSLPQLVKKFSLKRITKSNSRFNPEKFLWINGQHLKILSDEEYAKSMTEFWKDRTSFSSAATPQPEHPEWLKILKLYKTRARTWKDLEVQAGYIFQKEIDLDSAVISALMAELFSAKLLEIWCVSAESMSFDSHQELEKMTREVAAKNAVQMGALVHPLRFAISGTKVTPGLFELMNVMGKQTCLERVRNLIVKASKTD